MQHTRSRIAHQHSARGGESASVERLRRLALRAVEVEKSYRYGVPGCGGSVRVLVGASLHVACGSVVGLDGAAGAGKSTLLLCCAGLMRPDVGRVIWARGIAGRALPPNTVAFVPQRPAFSSFHTVREVLDRYACAHRGLRRASATRSADCLAALAGLGRVKVGELSIGARWRLAFLVAMLGQPMLVVADGMDCEGSVSHLEASATLLHRIRERGGAVLVSVRDRAALEGVADRVLTICHGRVEESHGMRGAAARAAPAQGCVVGDPGAGAAVGSVDRVVAAI